MLQRDYFIRIIEEFGRALQVWLGRREEPDGQQKLEDLYTAYLGSYTTLRNMTWQEAVAYAADHWSPERRIRMLEMLADLWMYEGETKQNPLRDMLLDKAFMLYDYIESKSGEYSLVRRRKMKHIASLKNIPEK